MNKQINEIKLKKERFSTFEKIKIKFSLIWNFESNLEITVEITIEITIL